MSLSKSTPDEIRARFDADVERFSNLETGHGAAMDSPLMLDLIAEAAAFVRPAAEALLDVGSGAGNYTLKVLDRVASIREITLLDLSRPMLDRAVQRIGGVSPAAVTLVQEDVREADLGEGRFDVILAAMVLHHLREAEEWSDVYGKLHRALKPGGWLFVGDMVDHDAPVIRELMRDRYGRYLEARGGAEYRAAVFDYTEKEDSPRSVGFQVEVMRAAGFVEIEVLHKHATFAAFAGRRAQGV